ncbi:MAG: ATP-dependent DNA helicase, partial [Clostridia bacterium]|nr:ATP-dependent DNA helicase [Clostridia bacterium]
YARGFYDRLPAALLEAVKRAGERGGMILGREALSELARRHALCPFELSLELAKLSDVAVGDYNYVYDPFVSIEALLGVPGGAALLVDEAHQLAPRVRDALSAEIGGEELAGLRREIGRAHGRRIPLYRALTGAIGALEAAAQDPAFGEGRLAEPPAALGEAMELVLETASAQLAAGGVQADADAFSLAASFRLAQARFDERYALLSGGEGRCARLSLLCLNAAPEILEQSKRARGTAYFSATLAPLNAARRMLGSEEGDACLALPSPFRAEQLEARVAPIDIRYAARERTAPQVAEAIARQLGGHAGNALVFFPSYAYLAHIAERIEGMENGPDIALLREKRGMTEEEKAALLAVFGEEDGRAALFAVLGGAFAEGIDLPGRMLQNVIVVSTGLPQPDERIRAMQAYYDRQGEDGFDLCMTLPGMVRVIQAAGRLIRTDTDTGSLLLIDSRFARPRERALLSGTLIGDALGIR